MIRTREMGGRGWRGRPSRRLLPRRLTVFFALLCLLAGAHRVSFSDEIDQILSSAKSRLALKKGWADGRVLGRDGEYLRMSDEGVEFRVDISELADDASANYAKAEELMGEGHFHRAAINFGLARLLQPADPRVAKLAPSLIDGLRREVDEQSKLRGDRESLEAGKRKEDMHDSLSKAHPFLDEILRSGRAPSPLAVTRELPDLSSWTTLGRLRGSIAAPLQIVRRGAGSVTARLQSLERLSEKQSDPLDATLARIAKADTRAEAALDLYLRAVVGLWIDHLRFVRQREQREAAAKNYTSPMDAARKRARALLEEQLAPTKKTREVRVGNFMREVEVPIDRDPKELQKLRPRLEAPFVEEVVKGNGIAFITSYGDRVLAPVDDWETFNAPPPTAGMSDEDFLAKPRVGIERFMKAAEALCLAWAADLEDPLLAEAVTRLDRESAALLQPGAASQPASAPASAPSR